MIEEVFADKGTTAARRFTIWRRWKFARTSANPIAGRNHGPTNTPNVTPCMRITVASEALAENASFDDAGNCSNALRPFVRDWWAAAHSHSRPCKRAEAAADTRERVQSGTLDANTIRDRYATRPSGARAGAAVCFRSARGVDLQRNRRNLKSARTLDANLACGDHCDCACVKNHLYHGLLAPARRDILSGMKKKNPAAVSLGRRGGRARAKALTTAERRAIAAKAIRARWARVKKNGA